MESARFLDAAAFRARSRAAIIHLALSVAVVALAAALVFVLWYPMPFREISGGRELFLIVVAVDVVIGPLITFAVFNLRKPRRELVVDLGIVGLLQLAALAYGLHTVADARPAVVALEGDRLRVVRAIDLSEADFSKAPPDLRSLSLTGPTFVATRPPSASEKLEAIERGLAGQDIGMRPEFWQPTADKDGAYARAAKPLADLRRLHPARAADIDRAAAATGRAAEQLGFLPILARSTDWSALVERSSGSVVGFVNLDGF